MTNNTSRQQVIRILYKEIVQGDIKKILAESNHIRKDGGGARDFRFGSYAKLAPAIAAMFPQTVVKPRKRGGVDTVIDVFKGKFYWQQAGSSTIQSKDAYFEPPTDARPSEGRIVRVSDQACFDTHLIPRGGHGNRVLLLLVQLADGKVWPHYAEEQSLRRPNAWDPVVARELLNCIDAERGERRAVIGFRDFTTNMSYCNGK